MPSLQAINAFLLDHRDTMQRYRNEIPKLINDHTIVRFAVERMPDILGSKETMLACLLAMGYGPADVRNIVIAAVVTTRLKGQS